MKTSACSALTIPEDYGGLGNRCHLRPGRRADRPRADERLGHHHPPSSSPYMLMQHGTRREAHSAADGEGQVRRRSPCPNPAAAQTFRNHTTKAKPDGDDFIRQRRQEWLHQRRLVPTLVAFW